ncbi:hypothetical protein BOTBODRAFT_30713 [Botryobasidium botryosum FD-172 SS1]|uniref:RNI-like protein n=1 Tax=Botryobasidium botryosum (strain FD-172 SS1) TaxID=930990 RepID=A0A067MY96_BOTB1|nr:hypothetical protein BOTBODRAFT_30713 [Botryobasidium botryosum FD-172 SS1]
MASSSTAVAVQASSSSTPAPYVPPRPKVPAHPPKGILKQPPPPPTTFLGSARNIFSGSLSKFLPPSSSGSTVPSLKNLVTPATPAANVPSNGSDASKEQQKRPLKRAHFFVHHMSTTYPISSQAPPCSEELLASKKDIETKEREKREREILDGAGAWNLARIEEFYRDCCKMRDEYMLSGVTSAIRTSNVLPPRTLDLSGVKLTVHSAAALADLLSVEWGLRKLILSDCDLDDLSIKSILHALLIPASLPHFSLSCNKRLKSPAFKLIGFYLEQARVLQFLDLSEIPLDKRSVECLLSALAPAPANLALPDTSSSALGASFTSPPLSPLLESPASGQTGQNQKGAQLVTLRLDDCSLRSGNLEALAHAVRPSALQHLSIRSNKIGPMGAVAIALMIKDYPDSIPAISLPITTGSSSSLSPTPSSSAPSTPRQFATELLPAGPPPGRPASINSIASASSNNSSLLSSKGPPPPPPPRHPSTLPPSTTYTPYIPRSKRGLVPAVPSRAISARAPSPSSGRNVSSDQVSGGNGNSGNGRGSGTDSTNANVPLFTSSRTGGITMRHAWPPNSSSSNSSNTHSGSNFGSNFNSGAGANQPSRRNSSLGGSNLNLGMLKGMSGSGAGVGPSEGHLKLEGHSAALLDKVRSLDSLPRLGALQTLDLRGNDIRGGVSYIAQVLKRNRTLRILNLSENRIDVMGLASVAEALKYNSTLETLDLSRNPCCGPGLEGITSLRTAFTINSQLKRLFLSSTSLTSSAAIALAEFLPEAHTLLYLDLTHNTIDLAGVMALSVGLKMNETLRCLDVNVPPNDVEMARLSQEILWSCVRNTERAAGNEGAGLGMSGSALGLSEGRSSLSEGLFGILGALPRGGVWGLIEQSELAKGVKKVVEQGRVGEERKEMKTSGGRQKMDIWKKTPAEVVRTSKELLAEVREGKPTSTQVARGIWTERAQALVGVLVEMVQVEKEPSRLEELLALTDQLNALVLDLRHDGDSGDETSPGGTPRADKGKGKAIDLPSEPTFSIVDSDDEEHDGGGRPHESAAGDENGESGASSPIMKNKVWVEEEGEVFRRGNVLLGPEEMDEGGETTVMSGEELKHELLQAQVERPRHRALDDSLIDGNPPDAEAYTPRSPVQRRASADTV